MRANTYRVHTGTSVSGVKGKCWRELGWLSVVSDATLHSLLASTFNFNDDVLVKYSCLLQGLLLRSACAHSSGATVRELCRSFAAVSLSGRQIL